MLRISTAKSVTVTCHNTQIQVLCQKLQIAGSAKEYPPCMIQFTGRRKRAKDKKKNKVSEESW